jgi:hypothetical protein
MGKGKGYGASDGKILGTIGMCRSAAEYQSLDRL